MNLNQHPFSIRPAWHGLAALTVVLAGLAGPASAYPSPATAMQRAVVISVHPAHSSAAFIATYGLPWRATDGGRFAVVRVVDGAWGEASFALVYVPADTEVDSFDLVELDASAGDVLTHPGRGVVARVERDAPVASRRP